MPMVIVMAPSQSMRALRAVCGMFSTAATTRKASTPIGTFTRKTQRQPSMPRMLDWPASAPPMTGPSTLEVPNTARNMPWYLARSRGGTMSPMIASARDIRPPAPRPWKARNAASSYMELAKVQASEPTTKIEIAAR